MILLIFDAICGILLVKALQNTGITSPLSIFSLDSRTNWPFGLFIASYHAKYKRVLQDTHSYGPRHGEFRSLRSSRIRLLSEHLSNLDVKHLTFTDKDGRSTIAHILELVKNQKDADSRMNKDEKFGEGHVESKLELPPLTRVMGWVQSMRKVLGGEMIFVDVNDGSSPKNLQVVVSKAMPNFDEISTMEKGNGISVVGSLDWRRGKPTDKARLAMDLYVDNYAIGHRFTVYENGASEVMNPVVPSMDYSLEYLRQYYHLRSRTRLAGSVFRIRGRIMDFTHEFFYNKNYICMTVPLMTGVNCEGIGDLFKVSVSQSSYGVPTIDPTDPQIYLSVSGQLELEAMCCSMGNVWKFGPAFRAERSDTPRHLAEFWMLEAEAIGIGLEDIMSLVHEYVKGCCELLLNELPDDVNLLTEYNDIKHRNRLEKMASSEMKVISYSDAVELLNRLRKQDSSIGHSELHWGSGLSPSHEKALVKYFDADMLAVTRYPESLQPFYMRSFGDKTVENVDILAPMVGELAGGSIREDRYEVLLRKMRQKNILGKEYDRYLQLRQFGNMPHGGFGIGFERLIMFLTGMRNIKDVIPYPKVRTKNSVR